MPQQKVSLVPLDLNEASHLGCMFTVRSHPEVAQFMPGNPPANFLQHVNYLYHVKNKEFFIIQIDNTPCGYCQGTLGEHEIELGWALHPNYWGKGIGSEAVKLLVDRFATQDKKIVLFVQKNNQRALTLYKKHSFNLLDESEDDNQYKMELVYAHSP